MRLLVVDDNEDITEAIGVYCTAQKIDCQIINDGKQGLEAIRNGQYDLILLDWAMPVFTGLDVVNSLQQEGQGTLKSKNIVIFTASSDPKILTDMKDSGIKEIFKKPCSLDELTELIEKYRPGI